METWEVRYVWNVMLLVLCLRQSSLIENVWIVLAQYSIYWTFLLLSLLTHALSIYTFFHFRWHGFGRASFANGDRYEGEYRFDQRHGRGIYSWSVQTVLFTELNAATEFAKVTVPICLATAVGTLNPGEIVGTVALALVRARMGGGSRVEGVKSRDK
jgi:hypothetical protein